MSDDDWEDDDDDASIIIGRVCNVRNLLLYVAIEIVQEAVLGQSIVVVAVNIYCGKLLGGRVDRIDKLCQQ